MRSGTRARPLCAFGVYKVKHDCASSSSARRSRRQPALPSLNDAAVGPALRRRRRAARGAGRETCSPRTQRDVAAARGDARRGSARPAPPGRAARRRRSRASSRRPRRSSRSSGRSRAARSPNGLQVRELRIPVGTIGANFEARPGVALDIAAQVLKSLNAVVLRTGGAALADGRDAGRRGAAAGARGGGHRRPAPSGSCARPIAPAPRRSSRSPKLDPARDPARQRRLDRGARAPRGRERRAHARPRRGRRRPLRPRLGRADRVTAIVDASLDRLGVCNRLNLALVDREAAGAGGRRSSRRASSVASRCVGTARAAAVVPVVPLERADRPRVGERPGASRDGDARPRRRSGRGRADREHRDLRARGRHRRRGRRRRRALLLALPRHVGLLARDARGSRTASS